MEGFQWIGTSTPSKNRKTISYNSFSSGGNFYGIGEYVLIRNDDSVDPEDVLNCYIAQIKGLYEKGSDSEPYQAHIKWFSRTSDLPAHCQKSLDKIHDFEIVEDNRRGWSSEIDAETIFDKCQVVFIPPSERLPRGRNENGEAVFFCRYKLVGNKLKPVENPASLCSKTNSKDSNLEEETKQYIAMSTGSPQFPRVLIKKIDDKILQCQNENIRVLVAKPDAKCIEDVTANLDELTLLNRKPIKRPYIHSLLKSSPCKSVDIPIDCLNLKSDTEGFSSPSKRARTQRRLEFSPLKEFTVTRSGRKVKAVSHAENYGSDGESEMKVMTHAKKKLFNFVRSTYSDDSGDDSMYSLSGDSDSESVESDSSMVDQKPSKSVKKTKRSKSKSNKNPIIKKTFCIPDRKTPLKGPQNMLEESRLRLHVSAVPKSLPCREEEFDDIYEFVKGCLCSHSGGCMYISGVPGTGKTATVHEVIRNLEHERNEGEVPIFKFVEVNGMWVTDPYQCYVSIFKSLTGKTIASQQAANLLEKRFTENGPKKDAVILLVDELDRLWTRKQTVLYNIFDWPSKKHSKLIVLAIANTMDLPERLMMNRISSRLGLTRKIFQPYHFKQLQEIIMSRIQELKVFDSDAVQFVSRKVAAVSGDARRALDICRHATEVAERSNLSPKKKSKILVGMEHVDIAIQQMFSSPIISAIRCSSQLEKLFFQAVLADFKRTGSEETTLLKVSEHLDFVCRLEGILPPPTSEMTQICAGLVHSNLILVDNFRNGLYMKIRLNASPDDVDTALFGKF